MRRPLGVSLLAVFVAWASFGLLPLALVALLPHSDFPLQPLPSLLGLSASAAGFVLARLLWRQRPSAAAWLARWTGLVIAFMLFWPVLASPGRERRGAVVGVLLGAAVLAGIAAAGLRRLRAAPAAATGR